MIHLRSRPDIHFPRELAILQPTLEVPGDATPVNECRHSSATRNDDPTCGIDIPFVRQTTLANSGYAVRKVLGAKIFRFDRPTAIGLDIAVFAICQYGGHTFGEFADFFGLFNRREFTAFIKQSPGTCICVLNDRDTLRESLRIPLTCRKRHIRPVHVDKAHSLDFRLLGKNRHVGHGIRE